ncbi:lysophospholipid acyltransferase family protein [Mycoplasma sp. 744]|uniref:lysophospholipid acyltransferase family protein n=1 Tax=Mycoplasma sp. 744 TaxID=3108531 RepID=UPI002B1D048D|nr:lysophospholipid acyltransferase family protein [Mycoplasma sp. 744]MEA4115310.1 lysophospholipid acyltransferase family protein [Mycoplasma sp. 744]
MKFILKLILSFPILIFNLWRIRVYARKYKKYPEHYYPQQRITWLTKKVKLFLWLYGIKLIVKGYENVPKGQAILVANHKSNIDPILLLKALEKQTEETGVPIKIPTFLAKKELEKSKIATAAIKLTDSFFIDRQNFREAIKTLNNFGTFIKNNHTLGIIFPEGTRVKENNLGEFKSGAFKIAINQYLPIIPVAISDTRDALNRKRKHKLNITVKFLSPLKPNNFITMNSDALANKVKKIIEDEFNNV